MKEIRTLLKLYKKEGDRPAALATVINVEGSSYRRTGARMLIYENGTWKGGISGGCLENDVLKNAKLVILHQKARTIRYDTTEGDSNNIGVGLGCNGIIDILISPIRKGYLRNPLEILQSFSESRQSNLLITVIKNETAIDIEEGEMFHFSSKEALGTLLKAKKIINEIQKTIDTIIERKRTQIVQYQLNGQEFHLLFEILEPNIHLVIIGNNYDIYPMADLANVMGWDISLIANTLKLDKSILKKAKIYPSNNRQFPLVKTDNRTAVIMMSHDYKTDLANLKHYLSSSAGYIGLLGPRKRGIKLIKELQEQGIAISENNNRIFSPTGLDIGANNPEEIALSILAEIKTIFSDRKGTFLKDRIGSIH